MKIGAIYPQTELNGDPGALSAIGPAVEELGYDYLLMYDHVAGAVREDRKQPLLGPYSDLDPFHDPLVAFAYLAGITRHIELATGVLVLPQRQTLLVARQAADVDLVSGGRLRLGVAAGWNQVEFEALGKDFSTRGKRLTEQISYLRRLWSEAPLSFQGDFHVADRIALNPRPRRQIPIYCGGGSTPAYRRAAKLADGFIFSGAFEERILPGWKELQHYLGEEKRPASDFGAEYLTPDSSSIEQIVDLVSRWRDAGGSHIGVRSMGRGFTNVRQHTDFFADVMQRLAVG
jgi:probable F420-dependent oxidoreductase